MKKYDPNKGGDLQLGFFMPTSSWEPPPISSLPSWKGAKRIAIDAETKDPTLKQLGPGVRREGYPVGWAFAIDGGPKHYLPIRHEGGDNLPVEEAINYLKGNIKEYTGEYVGANLAYDVDYGYEEGFEWHEDAIFRDVQIADPLIYEMHFSYSLKNIGERYGIKSKDEDMLYQAARALGLDPKAGLWRMPGRYVGEYAEQDVASPLELLRLQEEKIVANDLQTVWDLESKVLPVLVRMRRRGVLIDQDKLAQIEQWALQQEEEALEYIHRETLVRIPVGEVWKPDALAPALEAIGLKLGRTSQGKPNIDKAVLGGCNHPVAKNILHARKVNKLRTTFAASIHTYMVKGRIHCTFNQIARETESGEQKGARYGRLSATDPNLQQQPSPDRDPVVAAEWRKIFIPEPGAIWGVNDYKQQEPKWTTHFAALMDLPMARAAAERYRNDPDADNHEMMTRLAHGDTLVEEWMNNDPATFKVKRGYCKNVFLGLCYGEGGAKLCGDLGLPTRWRLSVGWGPNKSETFYEKRSEAWLARGDSGKGYIKEVAGVEGQRVLDEFDTAVPYVKKLAALAGEQVDNRGYVKTISGRRLHFRQRDDGSYEWIHKALNRVIQGTSADQTKQAIIDIDRAGHFLQLQVHDETDGSYSSVEEAKEVGQIMRDAHKKLTTALVPFSVDTECGPSWGEAK